MLMEIQAERDRFPESAGQRRPPGIDLRTESTSQVEGQEVGGIRGEVGVLDRRTVKAKV